MSNRFIDASALCPFYAGERNGNLYCEGIDWHSSTVNAFSSGKFKKEYKNSFCCAEWQKCRLAKALESKYD